MPKKAKRRNGYFYFMLDFKRREENKGVVFPKGFGDVAVFAAAEWKNLPQNLKEKYNDKAKEYNKSELRNQGVRTNSATCSRLIRVPSLNRKPDEREVIERMVNGKSVDEILDLNFYLIHVNVFLITEDECFPAELSISQFNLRQGVTKVFHRFFNPGKFPLGYELTVKQHIEKTHRIPVNLNKSDRGYLGMYNYVLKFLKEDNDGEIPPLFTMPDNPFMNFSQKAAKFALKRIWETGNDEEEEDGEVEDGEAYEKVFRVHNLTLLFYVLKEKCVRLLDPKGTPFINTQLAKYELEKDRYGFDEDIACQFHQEIDTVQYCSQSYTVRWGRVIRENCCDGLIEDEESDEAEEDIQVKQEQDIKTEKDRIKEEPTSAKVKNERDMKVEKDVKTEKEQNLVPSTSGMQRNDVVKVKCEKQSTSSSTRNERSETTLVRVKTEKPEPPRTTTTIRVKSEHCETSNRVKTEKLDQPTLTPSNNTETGRRETPVRVKTEKPDRPSAIPSSSIQTERVGTPIKVKTEKVDQPTITSSNSTETGHCETSVRVKTEKPDRPSTIPSSSIQTERLGTPIKVKTEKVDQPTITSSNSTETGHRETPVRVKTEKPDPPSAIPSSSIEIERPESITVRIKTEKPDPPIISSSDEITSLESTPIRIKTENPDSHSSISSSVDIEYHEIPPTKVKTEKPDPQPTTSTISIKTERPKTPPIRVKTEQQLPSSTHDEMEIDRIPTPPPAPIIRPKLERGLSPTRPNREKTPPRPILIRSQPHEPIRVKSESQTENTVHIKNEPRDPPPNRDPRLRSKTDSPQRDPRLQTVAESRDPRNRSRFNTVPVPTIKLEKDVEPISENPNKRSSSILSPNSSDIKRQRQTAFKEEEVAIKSEPVESAGEIYELKHEEYDLGYDFISNRAKNEKEPTEVYEIPNYENCDSVTAKTERIVTKIKKEIVGIEEIKNENGDVKEELFTSQDDLD